MITGINFYGYHLQIVSIMATLQRKKEYAITKQIGTLFRIANHDVFISSFLFINSLTEGINIS